MTYRFGVFTFDAATLDLKRDERPIRLQRQPAQVLRLLLEHAGGLVTREQLRAAVWGEETFVDFDRGLNFCIAQIRSALVDDAGTPRYIRTVPKKGYEFICAVETASVVGVAEPAHEPAAVPPARGNRRVPMIAAAVLVVAAVAAGAAAYRRAASTTSLPILAVARFDNETADPALTNFSDALTDTLVERLTTTGAGRFEVIGNASILRGLRDRRDLRAIHTDLHANYVVIGQVQRDAGRVRVLGHLIRLPEQTHLSVARIEDVAPATLESTGAIAARISEVLGRRLPGGGAAP